jgi:hypothetical protein
MSEENVKLVRGYYEAVQGVFGAYWEDPGSAAESLETGEVPPAGVEMLRYLHPNVEWKTALTGITYRAATTNWLAASTKLWTPRRTTESRSKR